MKVLLSTLLMFTSFLAFAKNPIAIMKTNKGEIHIELDMKNAPISSKNFLKYAAAKKYDGTIYHRVISNFMIQGGGFTSAMSKVATYKAIKNEAHNGLQNKEGTIAMARTGEIHSATNQFFINVADNSFLNHRSKNPREYGYAVFGKVVKGMSVVNMIKKVRQAPKSGHQNVPVDPIIIHSIRKK